MTHAVSWCVCHDACMCVSWLNHRCAMTHAYTWHAMTQSSVWHDSSLCVPWLLHMPSKFMCVTWLVHVCAMTHFCVWRVSSFVWHGLFVGVPWLSSYVCHDSLPRVGVSFQRYAITRLVCVYDVFICVTCLIRMCAMTDCVQHWCALGASKVVILGIVMIFCPFLVGTVPLDRVYSTGLR